MKVHVQLDLIELNDKDVALKTDGPKMAVLSHWNNDDLVRLEFGGSKVTVPARALKTAIDSATHWRR